YSLNIDRFLVALGWRSTSLDGGNVTRVIEKHADLLNVTANSHLDQCTIILEKFWNPDYAPEDIIQGIANFSTIYEFYKSPEKVMRSIER
ncbi:hypothetical protein PMAYCL1PPCAC_12912, partial [Pristionchus mayeri]